MKNQEHEAETWTGARDSGAPDASAKKKNGRPRLEPDDKAISVTLSMLEGQYAALCRKAARRRVTPSAILRQYLARVLGVS